MNMESSMSDWFEELPPQCPEGGAQPPRGEEYFRLIEDDSISCEHFWSHRKRWPDKTFHTSECRARAVSVFEAQSYCEDLLKLAIHEGKRIAKICLKEESGVVKRTGRPGHFSWWRRGSYDVVANSVLVVGAGSHE